MTDLENDRIRMVMDQIRARGVRDPAVLQAMSRVPRERFVPVHLLDRAYDDSPLPIAEDQTISQPYIVAYMVEALALLATVAEIVLANNSLLVTVPGQTLRASHLHFGFEYAAVTCPTRAVAIDPVGETRKE